MTTLQVDWRGRRFGIWLATAIAINAMAFLIPRVATRPEVALGFAFDVAITVPALYYWLVVRAGLAPAATLIPLCLAGLARAVFMAPGAAWARPVLGAAAEIAVVGYLVVQVRRGLQAGAGESDPLERLTLAARPLVRAPMAAEILAGEIATFWYALGGWGRKPHVPEGARAFTTHEQTITGALFWTFAVLSVVEASIVHVVVQRWSLTAAWICTGLSLYGGFWMVAVARSLALRPILVLNGELVIRSGILWTLRVPVEEITTARQGTMDEGFHLPPASDANVVLEFREPVTARALYGIRKRVTRVGLAVDDAAGFLAALGR